MPRFHDSRYEALTADQTTELAGLLKSTLGKLDKVLDGPAFNYFLHTSPFRSENLPHYHWHIEIIPRTTRQAGFEWGSGCYINAVAPEQAATDLRGVKRGKRGREHRGNKGIQGRQSMYVGFPVVPTFPLLPSSPCPLVGFQDSMRIGIFGGTFDPPHVGHLILAERCREAAGLDEVWFLVSYRPPHKADGSVTRFEHRCDMAAMAITGQPAFRVEPIEKELPPPSYTAETLTELRHRHPGDEFHLILGGDSVADLPKWHEPANVVAAAGLIGVARPGVRIVSSAELASDLGRPTDGVRLQWVESPLIDVASREIRQRVADGKTIRYLVPRAVEEFVRERGLYRGAQERQT